MGEWTDSLLLACRPLQLLVLSAPALAALAMQLPAVVAALDATSAAAVPAGGSRLSRVALRPPPYGDPVHG